MLVWAVLQVRKRARLATGDATQGDSGYLNADDVDLENEALIASQLPEEEWLRLARQQIVAGQYRLAMRALFLGVLANLGERRRSRAADRGVPRLREPGHRVARQPGYHLRLRPRPRRQEYLSHQPGRNRRHYIANIINTPETRFLDWEYACDNDPFFDLATIVAHHNMTQEQSDFFLDAYFEGDGTRWREQLARQTDVYEALLWLWGAARPQGELQNNQSGER